MDERGVKTHVLTLSGAMPWWWASQDAANTLARIVNDADRSAQGVSRALRRRHCDADARSEAALRELDRVAGEPGIRAVHLPNSD
jgi:hypothetical protein